MGGVKTPLALAENNALTGFHAQIIIELYMCYFSIIGTYLIHIKILLSQGAYAMKFVTILFIIALTIMMLSAC